MNKVQIQLTVLCVLLFSSLPVMSKSTLLISKDNAVIKTYEYKSLKQSNKDTIVLSSEWAGQRGYYKSGTYTGTYLTDLIKSLNLVKSPKKLKIKANNGFESVIPMEDVIKYKLFLAHEIHNRKIKGREYGPLLILPGIENHDPIIANYLVWFVIEIIIED